MASSYGAAGTLTYGDLFGGGTALYGAYGASSGGPAARIRLSRYTAYEHSAATSIERSAARAIELSEGATSE